MTAALFQERLAAMRAAPGAAKESSPALSLAELH
jgi:hypothetical protein